MNEHKGLYGKYIILKSSTAQPIEGQAFVLKVSDPHAKPALLAYADSCQTDNPELAADIRAWYEEVQQ